LPGGFSIGLMKYFPAFVLSDYSKLYCATFGISKGLGLFYSYFYFKNLSWFISIFSTLSINLKLLSG